MIHNNYIVSTGQVSAHNQSFRDSLLFIKLSFHTTGVKQTFLCSLLQAGDCRTRPCVPSSKYADRRRVFCIASHINYTTSPANKGIRQGRAQHFSLGAKTEGPIAGVGFLGTGQQPPPHQLGVCSGVRGGAPIT